MATAVEPQAPKDKRPSTAHLKQVPETRELRDRVRAEAALFGKTIDRSRPLTKQGLRGMAEGLLNKMGLGEQYLGFMMVAITNEFWREQVSATDFKRRLLLLPHCLKHAEGCPADYDEFGLDCRKCGACSVADFKTKAEDLGYKVLVSEGTPIVLKIIVSGHVDAIVGVACLNVLEKALDKILLAGVPCVAAPLLSSNCRSTSVDDDWVADLIDLRTAPPEATTKTYVHLLRAANQICEEPELSRLARIRSPSTKPSPMTGWARAASARGRSSRSPSMTPSRARPARAPPRPSTCPMPSSARPWPSRRFTRRRSSTTTSRTTTPSATAAPRCIASTVSAPRSTSAIT